jgi:hypothetical protein
MAWLLLLLIAGFFLYRHFTRATWKDLPTLREYLDAFPRCQTSRGICCRICNSGSIRNWGWKSSNDARRMFICNHCGQILYRNDLDS